TRSRAVHVHGRDACGDSHPPLVKTLCARLQSCICAFTSSKTRRTIMGEPLLLEKNGPVATMTFNQPEKANALDPAWLPRMMRFVQEIEHDSSIRCVLIKGNGKHFMAGGSLEYMDRFMSSPPEERAI